MNVSSVVEGLPMIPITISKLVKFSLEAKNQNGRRHKSERQRKKRKKGNRANRKKEKERKKERVVAKQVQ